MDAGGWRRVARRPIERPVPFATWSIAPDGATTSTYFRQVIEAQPEPGWTLAAGRDLTQVDLPAVEELFA